MRRPRSRMSAFWAARFFAAFGTLPKPFFRLAIRPAFMRKPRPRFCPVALQGAQNRRIVRAFREFSAKRNVPAFAPPTLRSPECGAAETRLGLRLCRVCPLSGADGKYAKIRGGVLPKIPEKPGLGFQSPSAEGQAETCILSASVKSVMLSALRIM